MFVRHLKKSFGTREDMAPFVFPSEVGFLWTATTAETSGLDLYDAQLQQLNR
jgi:hypothetical protein